MSDQELVNIIKKKFRHLSDKKLVERLNNRFKAGKNDDDEVFELFQRKARKGLKIKVGYDRYDLI